MRTQYRSGGFQLLSGVLMVIAGIASFFMPHLIPKVLVFLLALSTLASGISALVFYLRNRNQPFFPIPYLFNGLLNIVLGVLLFFVDSTAFGVLFLYLLGGWLVVQSLLHIAGSVGLKQAGFSQWWLTLIVAILGIVLALVIFFNPLETLMTVSVVAGIYLLIYGIVRIVEFFSYQ